MSQPIELTGRIIHYGDVITRGAKGFQTRMVVIEEQSNDKYPARAAVEFGGGQLDESNGYAVGDLVRVLFNLSAREWQGKWFGSLRGYKLRTVGGQAAPAPVDQPPTRPEGYQTFDPPADLTANSPAEQAAGVASGEPAGESDNLPF